MDQTHVGVSRRTFLRAIGGGLALGVGAAAPSVERAYSAWTKPGPNAAADSTP